MTSHAFHSPMMDAVVEPFAESVRAVALREPRIPFVSTVTGAWIRPEEATSPLYWARHLRETVRFRDGVATLLSDPGRALLEVGPRATLSTLARRQAKVRTQVIVPSLGDGEGNAEWTALLQAVGQLWLAGVPLDARAFHAHETRRRVPLPTYPFDRRRFWVEATPASGPRPGAAAATVVAPAYARTPCSGAGASHRRSRDTPQRSRHRRSPDVESVVPGARHPDRRIARSVRGGLGYRVRAW